MRTIEDMMNDVHTIIPAEQMNEPEAKKMRRMAKEIARGKKKNGLFLKASYVACAVLMLGIFSLGSNDGVQATVKEKVEKTLSTLFDIVGERESYLTNQVVTSGQRKKEMVASRGGITVKVKQAVYSENQVLVDYSIRMDNYRKLCGENHDELDVAMTFPRDASDSDEYIFKKYNSGTSENDYQSFKLADITSNDGDTIEFIEIYEGEDFLYQGKEVNLHFAVRNPAVNPTDMEGVEGFVEFDIPVMFDTKFMEKEKEINIAFTASKEGKEAGSGKKFMIVKARNLLNGLMLYMEGDTVDNYNLLNSMITVSDTNGENLSPVEATMANGTGKILYRRNHGDLKQRYTISIEENGKVIEKIKISFCP